MCSRCLKRLVLGLLLTVAVPVGKAAPVLRVCADPNHLPFSNERREGFDNRIAELVARELGRPVEFVWWAERRNFLRNTLQAGKCDMVLGMPVGAAGVLATRPYYRSTYVFVERRSGAGAGVRTLDDPMLRRLRIGVHIVGSNYAPPADYLARRGVVGNVKGYSLMAAYDEANPAGQIVSAVARGETDVAVVWGPIGGYFARRQRVPLRVVPIPASESLAMAPLRFEIAAGVPQGREDLKEALDGAFARRREEIERILARYGVPQG